ncbi:MAG: carboxypeptidase regulatory-like domain-containing protein [Fuerstiella sp.]|nr:carboxypeptidase regulatory-like domain-containing protein [Fuerstiella sp.]
MRHWILTVLIVSAVGCSSDQVSTYPVSGRVVFENGNPVRYGTIEFTSAEHGTTATGRIDHDGRFMLGTYTANDGAAAGDHNAIVVQMIVADGAFEHTIDHGDAVPAKYAAYENSPLKVSVNSDEENVVTLTIGQ